MNPLLLAGPIFTIAGIIKKVYPPKTINSIHGYRTTSSMLNHDTWTVANNYSAQVLQISGIIQLLIGIALYYLSVLGKTGFFIGLSVVLISAISHIILTERHLKKLFTSSGERRWLTKNKDEQKLNSLARLD